jgi:hypothetical protein
MVKQSPPGVVDTGVVEEVRSRLLALMHRGAGPAVVAPPVAATTQPGWYPTADGAHVRWHDGVSWTEHVAPKSD